MPPVPSTVRRAAASSYLNWELIKYTYLIVLRTNTGRVVLRSRRGIIALSMTTTNAAVWTILYVCPPSEPKEAVGILLVDSTADRLLIRVKEELNTVDEDIEIVWGSFAEHLVMQSKDSGAERVLKSLESSASHAFQLSARHSVEAFDLPHTLEELYSKHVGDISDSISIPQ